MNPWYAVAIALFVAWVGGMAYYLRRAAPMPGEAPPPVAPEPKALPAGHVLHPAPRIGEVTLRDWLIHRHPREHREGQHGIWGEVVAEFYEAAAADPEIAAYFKDTDMPRLQSHFCSALCILTHTGLTVGALNAMRTKHAGRGITGPVYERTIMALAGVLEGKGVPGTAITDLLPAVEELRGVIVAGPQNVLPAPPKVPTGPRHRRTPA
jgi:truncated hemoglobin YjbI